MYNNPLYYRTQRPIQRNLYSPQARGVIAWWPPLASWGTNVLRDQSGQGNNGTFPGGTANPQWEFNGEYGTVLRYDGSNDYINGGTFDVDGSGLTMAAWVNADTWEPVAFTDVRVIAKASGTALADHWWMMGEESNSFRSRIKVGGTVNTLVAGSLTTGTWLHLCVTYRGSDGLINHYINGVNVGSATHANSGPVDTDNTISVHLGETPPSGSNFEGLIGDTRVYNRGLSVAEIRHLYSPATRWDLYRPLPRQSYLAPAVAAGFPWPSKNRHPSTNVSLRL